MADGSQKPISEVKIGDIIANSEPDSDALQHHTVTAIHVTKEDRDFVDILIATPSGTKTITSTAHHPFWDTTTHAWTDATNLKPGDQLDTPHATRATVQTIRRYTATIRTYNLTIDTIHTYYVLAGTTPVLVHNSNGICGSANAYSFKRTEALSGNASKRDVDSLTASMKENGWQGDSISVAKIGDDLYILDGHHRVAAAKRAGIDVPYRVVSDVEIGAKYPGGAADIVTAWAEAGPDRIENKYKRPGYR
jgi:hypothetical protein